MHFAHGADHVASYQSDGAMIVLSGVDLRAKLRHAFLFARNLRDDARLRNGVRERLLAI